LDHEKAIGYYKEAIRLMPEDAKSARVGYLYKSGNIFSSIQLL